MRTLPELGGHIHFVEYKLFYNLLILNNSFLFYSWFYSLFCIHQISSWLKLRFDHSWTTVRIPSVMDWGSASRPSNAYITSLRGWLEP